MALVHNGDFANYFAVSEYLSQRHIFPQFLTDTEVAVLLFDLWHRLYGYPLEYVIEALAPTTERDFDLLPPQKQRIYRQIQSTCIHGSPDGPWFFIIARNDTAKNKLELIGITDTSMLRPQVFALSEGEVQIGLVCSEKQAIDATLASLAEEDPRFCPVADLYWNARGGSHTDGGSFTFSLESKNGKKVLSCHDKFGNPKTVPWFQHPWEGYLPEVTPERFEELAPEVKEHLLDASGQALFQMVTSRLTKWPYARFLEFLKVVEQLAPKDDDRKSAIIEALTLLTDRRYDTGEKKRSHLLRLLQESLARIFAASPKMGQKHASRYNYIDWQTRESLAAPPREDAILILDAAEFPPEGDDCDARLLCRAFELGWRRFICYGYRGQRFLGCGFGLDTDEVRIDVYGSSGDYLASGIDGMADLRPRQRPGPTGPDHEAGQAGGLRRCRPDLHVRRQGWRGVHHGQRRRPPAHQRRRPAPGGDQRHGPGLPGRVLHGRRPHERRRLRHPQRHDVRSPGSDQGAGQPLSRLQPLLAGLRRGDFHPGPLPADDGRTAERRRNCALDRGRLAADPALPRGK